MKTGIVDVGGGYRGVYACGVLDYCLDHRIAFDAGIGVSAGSANLSSYCSGQRGRNRRFYTEYGLRRQYAGMGNWLTKRSFIDLDYVYSTLSNSGGEDPLDYEAIVRNPMTYSVVATEALTGKPRYFDKSDLRQDDYGIMKASSAIPFVCRPYEVNGALYYDGALSDPVPIQHAFDLGCERVVLILTLPRDTVRTPAKDQKVASRIQRKYPLAAEGLRRRAETYNRGVERAKAYEAQGKLLIVAPENTFGVQTLCRDADAMNRLYESGYRDGERILPFLQP